MKNLILCLTFLTSLIFAEDVFDCPENCTCQWQKQGLVVGCSGANLESIPDIFPKEMTSLDLSNNRLGLSEDAKISLSGYNNLFRLDLSGNFLTHQPKNLDESIGHLDLFGNNLKKFSLDLLPPNAFIVDAFKNQIKTLIGCEGEAKVKDDNPVELRLDGNKISTISEGTFENCSHTFSLLDFSSNALEQIESDAFKGVLPVENGSLFIDLTYNNLESFPFEAIQDPILFTDSFETLVVDLRKNPIDCSCNMSWVPYAKQYTDKMGLDFVILGTCNGPAPKTGMFIEDLPKASFKSCEEYDWLREEIKERTNRRLMPFWQVCLVVLALPALVASIVLTVGIRMHLKDYRRYTEYMVEKKRQKKMQRRQHFRASGAMGDVLLNSSQKIV